MPKSTLREIFRISNGLGSIYRYANAVNHPRLSIIGCFAVIGIAAATALLWPHVRGQRTEQALCIARQKIHGAAGDGVAVPSTNIVADSAQIHSGRKS